MKKKTIPEPGRIRQLPESFSWVDHRIIRNNRLQGCNLSSWTLYLFLITVADVDGVSYYSSSSICKRLGLDEDQLTTSILELSTLKLISYSKPFYQVLEVGNAQRLDVR